MLRALVPILMLSAAPAWASSRDERTEKRFDLSAQLIGLTGIVATYGVTLGWYADPDLVVEVGYAAGRDDEGEDEGDYEVDLFTSIAFVSAKIFTLDTLFVNVGLAQRAFDATLVAAGPTDVASDDVRTAVATRYLGVLTGVGNRWQWDTVHVGCEWVGVFMPLVRQKKEIDYTFAPIRVETEDERDKSESLVREGTQMSLNALRFVAGVAF